MSQSGRSLAQTHFDNRWLILTSLREKLARNRNSNLHYKELLIGMNTSSTELLCSIDFNCQISLTMVGTGFHAFPLPPGSTI